MMPEHPIVVNDHDPRWALAFEKLRDRARAALGELGERIEHVGSTSVPGLAAKPIIDMGVVVSGPEEVPAAIERLATIGYQHRGNRGVPGREAFFAPAELPAHHLYVYVDGCLALRNHIALRDVLREDPEAVREYGELKKQLAARFRHDIDAYIDGKTDLILKLLARAGLDEAELAEIAGVNRIDP